MSFYFIYNNFAGESGGNVLIKAEKVQNGEQLKIITNGGKGGAGQYGGNGRRGIDGVNVTKEDVEKIPDSAHTIYADEEANYEKVKQYITSYKIGSPLVKEENSGRCGNFYIKTMFENGFELTYLSIQLIKCLTLVKGSKGTAGGKGGNRGQGGEGGFPGQIQLDVPTNSHIQVRTIRF